MNPISSQISHISLQERERRNGHKAAILWFTGLPAAGKTTLALQLEAALFAMGAQVFSLDGDTLRSGLNKDLGFSEADRHENIRRIGEVAKLFLQSGYIVLNSFLSPYRQDRDAIRNLVAPGQFLEIFVDCSLQECERRDPKGHYRLARVGKIAHFTGISAPYEAPLHPQLRLDTEHVSVADNISRVMAYLRALEIV